MSGLPFAEVIGDPIGHSLSPVIHQFWLGKLGLDGEYRATRVMPECLAGYLAERRKTPQWRGCNITIPHKQPARALVDRAEDGGIGAINCVIPVDGELVGRNTDAGGLDASLPAGIGEGDRVVLVGSGGAAAAAVAALRARKTRCDVITRSAEQGRILLDRLGAAGSVFAFDQAGEAIAGSSGLINASPLGMEGFAPMPPSLLASLDRMGSGGFVLDMVYAPLRTALLATAQDQRLAAIDGLTMLIGQAGLAFAAFFDSEAPREHDAALRALLAS